MLKRELNESIAFIATGTQLKYYELHCAGNSYRQIAKQCGKANSSVASALITLEKNATDKGLLEAYSEEFGTGVGRHVAKVTTHIKNGQKVQEWIRTDVDKQDAETKMKVVIEALRDLIPIRDYVIEEPEAYSEDLMACIPIGDPHLGMYAWAEECGEDFDCEIAEQRTIEAVDRVVEAMPACGVCRIEELGDMFHSDTEDATTRRSGNHLDVDGRWGRVVKIALRMMTHCIDRCLEKHALVEVVCVKGNHDDQTAYCMAMMLDMYYRNDPRVDIDTRYTTYHFKEFGKVLLGENHGIIKPAALHEVMTCDMAEAWGRTKFRYWHVGHIHHHRVIEVGGCTVEAFRSLKSKDAYETERGYRSGQDLCGIVYHKEYGEIERHTVNVAMLNAK
jgi:hypothetical protein